MDVEGPIPLDEDMIERAGATLNDLVGNHIKSGVNNPYIDMDDYVKHLCRLYAQQILNAAFHGVAKMHTWTAEQVRESGRAPRGYWVERALKKRDEREGAGFKPNFKPGSVTMANRSKSAHPTNGGQWA